MTDMTPDHETAAGSENESELTEHLHAAGTEISAARVERFYDRLRHRIHDYLEAKGRIATKSGEFLLMAPDFFILLWRLANDSRVNGKNKVLLGSGLAYYFFPLDIVPELILGPVGFLDDVVFGVYMLNRMLSDTSPEILREHWSGDEDVLQAIQRVLNSADNLVEGDLLGKLKKLIK